ncbi:MAG: 23S rRNA (uracil(1939)-C(5))-methyltransferase RlmD [Candidatus Schekmanbacteria bacterium]|nr:23S rRNA (uracil(1939)-C(5))-methyltransferase RlmD [Candidatus Schekmanbacteria bacterium]
MENKRITIEKLVYGGYGLGHSENKAVFVPYSAPGDELSIELTSSRQGVQWARIQEIIRPSPLRCEPFCPRFGQSGGCQLQHIPYSEQLKHKGKVIAEAFQNVAGFNEDKLLPCIPSPAQTGYRRRVRLHWRQKGGLGFYHSESHDVVPIDHCPLLSPELNQTLSDLSSALVHNSPTDLSEIQIVQGSDEAVCLTLFMPITQFSEAWANKIKDKIDVKGISLKEGEREKILYGKGFVDYRVKNWKLRTGNSSFFQANLELLPDMLDHIMGSIEIQDIDHALELYAGVGLFSLPLAKKVRRLITIEGNRQAAEHALFNSKANKINNIAVKQIEVQLGLDLLISRQAKFDLVLLDPPREGLTPGIIARLQSFAPWQIIYISCNPATCARDVKNIVSNGQYELGSIQPLDMFPHTSQVEAVCSLMRKNR